MKTGVYRQNVGELEFTDRKKENQSLQKAGKLEFTDMQENWSLKIESRRTKVYRQKVGELELRNFRFILGNPSKLEKGEGFPNIFELFPNI